MTDTANISGFGHVYGSNGNITLGSYSPTYNISGGQGNTTQLVLNLNPPLTSPSTPFAPNSYVTIGNVTYSVIGSNNSSVTVSANANGNINVSGPISSAPPPAQGFNSLSASPNPVYHLGEVAVLAGLFSPISDTLTIMVSSGNTGINTFSWPVLPNVQTTIFAESFFQADYHLSPYTLTAMTNHNGTAQAQIAVVAVSGTFEYYPTTNGSDLIDGSDVFINLSIFNDPNEYWEINVYDSANNQVYNQSGPIGSPNFSTTVGPFTADYRLSPYTITINSYDPFSSIPGLINGGAANIIVAQPSYSGWFVYDDTAQMYADPIPEGHTANVNAYIYNDTGDDFIFTVYNGNNNILSQQTGTIDYASYLVGAVIANVQYSQSPYTIKLGTSALGYTSIQVQVTPSTPMVTPWYAAYLDSLHANAIIAVNYYNIPSPYSYVFTEKTYWANGVLAVNYTTTDTAPGPTATTYVILPVSPPVAAWHTVTLGITFNGNANLSATGTFTWPYVT